MTLAALMKKGGLGEVATAIPATAATVEQRKGGTVARIATVAVADPTSPKTASMPDPAAEMRRQRVLAMLAENPNVRRAVVVDNPDTDPVLLTVVIRGLATFELAIPAAKFDAFKLLALIERHAGAMVH